MGDWDDILDQAVEDIIGIVGLSSTYTPLVGDSVSCLAYLSKEADHMPVSFESGMLGHKSQIRARVVDLGKIPEAGESFTFASKSGLIYYVDSAEEIETDDRWAVCNVREESI
ncbi:MAG: hypothetical protein KJP23_10480 [Deltaproteobacteria bacterium]|nr:hypothetical protein [Deltaproteobacteria bacterium]